MKESLRFSRLSRLYECCVNNSYYYVLRNSVLNYSFLLGEQEFSQVIEHINKRELDPLIVQLRKAHILVERDYKEEKFLNYLKEKYNLDKPLINMFYFMFDSECNLNCKYCYVEKNFLKKFRKQKTNKATFEKLLLFLEKFIIEGIKNKKVDTDLSFIFYGSEPLLYPLQVEMLIKRIIYLSKKHKFKKEIKIITNGTLLNPELISMFKKYGVHLAVSLDGPCKVNDSMRQFPDGSGSYKKIIKFINCLNEKKQPFCISCTVGPHNMQKLKSMVLLAKNLGAKELGFNALLDKTNKLIPFVSTNLSSDFILAASKFAQSKTLYEDRFQKRIDCFNNFLPYLKDCGASGNQIVFYPDGEIGVCQAYMGSRKFIIGNLNKDIKNPLKILNSSFFRDWAKRFSLNLDECKFCPAVGICGGGCIFNAHKKSGNIFGRDKDFCVYIHKLFEYLLTTSLNERFKTEDIYIRDISFMFNHSV